MKQSKCSSKNRRRFLCALMGFLAMSLGPLVLGEEATQETPTIDLAELEQDIDRFEKQIEAHRAAHGTPRKAGGSITCSDNQCTGLYDDLISWRYERDDGFRTLRVTPAVQSYVEASSHNCLWKEDIVVNANNEDIINRWISAMIAADALGSEISFIWKQSNYSWGAVCILDGFYVFPAP